MSRSVLVNVLVMFVLVLAAATVIGLITYWPDGDRIRAPERTTPPQTEAAKVVGVHSTPCARVAGVRDCLRVTAERKSGPDEGREIQFTFAAAEGKFEVGDQNPGLQNPLPPEAIGAGGRVDPYSFSDFERRPPMLWLLAGFAGPNDETRT